MNEPKRTWILRSLAPPEPGKAYVGDDTYTPIIWAPWQREAHPFTTAAAAHEARRKLGEPSLRVFRLVPRTPAEWGEKHTLEARAALYRLAGDNAAKNAKATAHAIAYAIWQYDYNTATEPGFMRVLLGAANLGKKEAAAVIRTVRENAEDRAVISREEFFRVRLATGYYVPEQGEIPCFEPSMAQRFDRGTSADQAAAARPGARVATVKMKRRRVSRRAPS